MALFTQELGPNVQNALAGVSVLCGAYCLLADPDSHLSNPLGNHT